MDPAEFVATVHVAFASRSLAQMTPNGPRTVTPRITFSRAAAYRRWCSTADSVGFPVGGMTMALAVTPEELIVHSATFVRGHPKRRIGAIPLDEIAQMTVVRGVTKSQIVILLTNGGIVELEALSARRARRFVTTALELRPER